MPAIGKSVSFAPAVSEPSTLLPTEPTARDEEAEEVDMMDFERQPLADTVMLDSSTLAPPRAVASTSTAMDLDDGKLKFPAAQDKGVKTKSQVKRVPIPPRASPPRSSTH